MIRPQEVRRHVRLAWRWTYRRPDSESRSRSGRSRPSLWMRWPPARRAPPQAGRRRDDDRAFTRVKPSHSDRVSRITRDSRPRGADRRTLTLASPRSRPRHARGRHAPDFAAFCSGEEFLPRGGSLAPEPMGAKSPRRTRGPCSGRGIPRGIRIPVAPARSTRAESDGT